MYSNTKVFAIKNNFTLVLLAIWYSLISLLFGWWSSSLRNPFRSIENTLEAIHINLTGGIDNNKELNESEYDFKTNYIWNNLLRETTNSIDKRVIEIIIEIQEEFELQNIDNYSEENINFITINLRKIDIYDVNREQMKDIFDAFQSYEKNTIG